MHLPLYSISILLTLQRLLKTYITLKKLKHKITYVSIEQSMHFFFFKKNPIFITLLRSHSICQHPFHDSQGTPKVGLVPFLLCYGLEEFWERNRSIMSCSCRDPILSLGLLTVSPSKTLQRFYSTSTNQAKLGIALFLQGLNTLAVETKVLEGPMALFSVWCICPAQRGMSALHKDTQMAFFFFFYFLTVLCAPQSCSNRASYGVSKITSEVIHFMKCAPKPPHLIPGERKIKWMGVMGKNELSSFVSKWGDFKQ